MNIQRVKKPDTGLRVNHMLWPSQSPHPNPAEHRTQSSPPPSSKHQFMEYILEACCPVQFQKSGRIDAKAHWSCSGSLWWPNTILKHFSLIFFYRLFCILSSAVYAVLNMLRNISSFLCIRSFFVLMYFELSGQNNCMVINTLIGFAEQYWVLGCGIWEYYHHCAKQYMHTMACYF